MPLTVDPILACPAPFLLSSFRSTDSATTAILTLVRVFICVTSPPCWDYLRVPAVTLLRDLDLRLPESMLPKRCIVKHEFSFERISNDEGFLASSCVRGCMGAPSDTLTQSPTPALSRETCVEGSGWAHGRTYHVDGESDRTADITEIVYPWTQRALKLSPHAKLCGHLDKKGRRKCLGLVCSLVLPTTRCFPKQTLKKDRPHAHQAPASNDGVAKSMHVCTNAGLKRQTTAQQLNRATVTRKRPLVYVMPKSYFGSRI